MPQLVDLQAVIVIAMSLALGGMLKGATGAGTPIIAVPVIAAFLDIRLAVAVLALPNLCTNLVQIWAYRHQATDRVWTIRFVISGAVGAGLGTFVLKITSEKILMAVLTVIVVLYIALRLVRPKANMPTEPLRAVVIPAGFVGGILQGAAGVSAPVSVSYLNALSFPREQFIFTISAFFASMSAIQLPALFSVGLLTPELLGTSALALIPLVLFMPIGSKLAQRLTPEGFDRAILLLLSLLALRMGYSVFSA